jgi:hypothetical protein
LTYQRVTRDVWVIQTDYGYGDGWEDTTEEETRAAALEQRNTYRENQPEYPHRLIKRRERITDNERRNR